MTAVDKTEAPTPSLVLLLKAPRIFVRPVVRAAAERAFGVPFGADPGGKRYVVPTGRPGQYAIRFTEYLLGVTQGDTPYWSDPTFGPDLLGDPRASAAVVAHQAWVSVDTIGLASTRAMGVPEDRKIDAYRVMSRLASEFFDLTEEDCTALVVPEMRRVYPNDKGWPAKGGEPIPAGHQSAPEPVASIREMLSAKEPALLLGLTDPAMLSGDDPRILAAVEEARRRLPEFLKAWEQRGKANEGPFWVKATFIDKHGGEQMWVAVNSIENGIATGLLQSDPSYVKSVRQGQKVELKLEEVVDFLYHDGRAMTGAFTDRVIGDIMEGRR